MWQLGISLDNIPDTTKELRTFIADWTTPIDVRMIEYVEEAIEDKEKKKKLVEALKKHRDELKSFSEKSLKYLKEQGVKLVNRKDFTSLKPEEYLLRELFRLQKYLQTDPCLNTSSGSYLDCKSTCKPIRVCLKDSLSRLVDKTVIILIGISNNYKCGVLYSESSVIRT